MGFVELMLIAVGLSMDAFAVAVCTGLTMEQFQPRKGLIVGLYFGAFQALMPLLGYLVGHLFADMIVAVDHWIAFGLLALIGGKMIGESFAAGNRGCPAGPEDGGGDWVQPIQEASLGPGRMLPLALATSIDALAVGVTFSFLGVSIGPAASLIGVTTLLLSVVGVKVGHVFGARFKSKAELAGGVILILMGAKILLEHLGLLPW